MSAHDRFADELSSQLEAYRDRTLLRLIACGSVDDGKSTLIGRLLYDCNVLCEDHLASLTVDSKKLGTRGEDFDFALLLDGLAAEREQGITIDVAYRYFSSGRRAYIVADAPGHEQYTRNMVTGASQADLAIILIDARKGVLTQTRRHSHIVALLGIQHVVIAINKMDLVDYSQPVFERIEREYRQFSQQIGIANVRCIPVSAVHGDNLTQTATTMPWYGGPTLMQALDDVEVDQLRLQRLPLRLPVQWVNRPDSDFRGFAGTLASGVVRRGQRVCVQPSGRESVVSRIVTADGDLDQAVAHQSITLTLDDEVDVSRGDIFSAADSPAQVADRFEATVVWMNDQPLLPGRSYSMKIGTQTVTATVSPLKYKVDVNSLQRIPATKLGLNEIGVVALELDRSIAFDPYRDNRETGGFILIDRITNDTMGAGMLHFALRRAANVHWQTLEIDKAARQALTGHRTGVVWLTGLSGAGKTTLANMLEKRLYALGVRTYILDGDNIRHGLNKDLGFTAEDRVENIRRVAEVARLMADAGSIVITAFISPFRAERRMARELMPPGEFIEVFVDTPIEVAEKRDPKGLYAKARRGDLRNFTGIDSPYEAPEHPEVHVHADASSIEASVEQIFSALVGAGWLSRP